MSKSTKNLDSEIRFNLKELIEQNGYTVQRFYQLVRELLRERDYEDAEEETSVFSLQTLYNYANDKQFPSTKAAMLAIYTALQYITSYHLTFDELLYFTNDKKDPTRSGIIKANDLFNKHQFREAIKEYYDSLRYSSIYLDESASGYVDAEILLQLGICHFAVGEFQNSLERLLNAYSILEELIATGENNQSKKQVSNKSNKVFITEANMSSNEAINRYKTMLAKTNIRLANTLRVMGRTTEAIESCSKGLENIYAITRKHEKRISDLTERRKSDIEDTVFLDLLKLEKSVKEKNLDYADGLRIKALIKIDEGDFKSAKNLLKVASTYLPKVVDEGQPRARKHKQLIAKIAYANGRIFYSLGYFKKAEEAFQKASDIFIEVGNLYFYHLSTIEYARTQIKRSRNSVYREKREYFILASSYIERAKKYFNPEDGLMLSPYGAALAEKSLGYQMFFEAKFKYPFKNVEGETQDEYELRKKQAIKYYEQAIKHHEQAEKHFRKSMNRQWNLKQVIDFNIEELNLKSNQNTRKFFEGYPGIYSFAIGNEYIALGMCYQKLADITDPEENRKESLKNYVHGYSLLKPQTKRDGSFNYTLGDKRGMRVALNREGRLQLRVFKDLKTAKEKYDEAEDVYFECGKSDTLGNLAGEGESELATLWDRDIGHTYMGLGEVYYQEGKYLESRRYYYVAISIYDQLEETQDLAYCYYHLADTYLALADEFKSASNNTQRNGDFGSKLSSDKKLQYVMRAVRYNNLALNLFNGIDYDQGIEKVKTQEERIKNKEFSDGISKYK